MALKTPGPPHLAGGVRAVGTPSRQAMDTKHPLSRCSRDTRGGLLTKESGNFRQTQEA